MSRKLNRVKILHLSETSNSNIHLLFTSIITEKRRIVHKGSEDFSNRNRVDIFLSMLESMKDIPIKSAEFYLEFDETTFWGKELVMDMLNSLPYEIETKDYRLETFNHWKNASKSALLKNSTQILFFANDDHCFIPSNLDEFIRISEIHSKATNLYRDKQIMVPVSHFPESHAFVPISKSISMLLEYEDDLLVPVVTPIGAIIMNPADFISWFRSDFTQGARFVGPENPWGPSIRIKNGLYL